jgi:hypothetical protein
VRGGKEQDRQHGPQREAKPGRLPDTTPQPIMPSGDYSYVLEIVMRMQSTMGELKEAVYGLKESRTQQLLKLDKISDHIHAIKTKIYAAVAIVLIAGSVIGAILGIFGKPIVELIFNRATAPAQTTPTNQPR